MSEREEANPETDIYSRMSVDVAQSAPNVAPGFIFRHSLVPAAGRSARRRNKPLFVRGPYTKGISGTPNADALEALQVHAATRLPYCVVFSR